MGSYLAHGPEIYPRAHENPRAFSCIFGPIFLESSIQCPWGVGLHQTPPRSPSPHSDGQSKATSTRSRQSTRLRWLTLRTLDQPRPTVNVNPTMGRGSCQHKEKFHNYLRVIVQEKIPIVHNNWKDVPESLKDLVWDDILVSSLTRDVYLLLNIVMM